MLDSVQSNIRQIEEEIKWEHNFKQFPLHSYYPTITRVLLVLLEVKGFNNCMSPSQGPWADFQLVIENQQKATGILTQPVATI